MAQGQQDTLVNVYLHGQLGTLFGEQWKLLVSSPAEAIRAINVNTRGALARYLYGEERLGKYRVYLNDPRNDLDIKELRYKSGKNDIHVVPVVAGAGSGVGKIIVGALLIIAAVVAAIYDPPAAPGFFSAGWAGVAEETAISIGVSLIVGGITQLLTPVPQAQQDLNSSIFQGSIAAPLQGPPVPLVYGRMMVKPVPISILFGNSAYNTTPGGAAGSPSSTVLNGGGYQYNDNGVLEGAPPTVTPIINDSYAPPDLNPDSGT